MKICQERPNLVKSCNLHEDLSNFVVAGDSRLPWNSLL